MIQIQDYRMKNFVKKPQYIKYFYSEFSKQEYFIDIIKIEFF